MALCIQMPGVLFLLALLIQNPPPLPQRTGIVTGVLRTSTGTPIEGVRVALTPAEGAIADDLLENIELTDKDGRYRLENVSPGRYHVVIGRGFGTQYHPGVPERAGATVVSVISGTPVALADVIFARMRVTGRVIDWATGAGRHVQTLRICCDYSLIGTSSTAMRATTAGAPFTAAVKDDGTFVFEAVPRGKFILQAADPGIIAMGQSLVVADADIDDLQVRVSSGVEVRGDVFDRLGAPVPGAAVRLTSHPSSLAFGIAPNTLVSVSESSVVVFTVSGNPRTLSVDELQAALRRSVKQEFVYVDSGGRFTLDKLLPGRYVLEANVPGRNLIEREIEVLPSGVTNLRVDVPFTRITGRIVPGGGDPLPKIDGSIRILPSGPGSQFLYLFPDAEGWFFPLLAPGEYRVFTENLGRPVRTVADGARDLRQENLVFDGVRVPEIVITLEP
jgi:hypothetical protein